MPPSRDQIVRDLQTRINGRAATIDVAQTFQRVQTDSPSVPTFSTGSSVIDQWLPRGGLPIDSVIEWVAENRAGGTGVWSLVVAAARMRQTGGPLIVVAGADDFYPPAAAALGVAPERMVWVRPTDHADTVWAIDQSLRSGAAAAVWAHVGGALDDRDARRFQLAAETGRTPGLLVRPSEVRGQPSFANIRFHVRLMPTRQADRQSDGQADSIGDPVLAVTLDRCRGASTGQQLQIRIDDQATIHTVAPERVPVAPQRRTNHEKTAAVRLASELAHPKTADGKATRRRA